MSDNTALIAEARELIDVWDMSPQTLVSRLVEALENQEATDD